MNNTRVKLYDGINFCQSGHCPVVIQDKRAGTITLSDPSKPQNGQYTMTVKEYNTLLANAKKAV